MIYKVKNWSKFQHYKGKKPSWIKVYPDLLDDPEWHALPADTAKMLLECWLVASKSEDGSLPEIAKLSFMLRKQEITVIKHLERLEHWLYTDSRDTLDNVYTKSTTEERRGDKNRVDKREIKHPAPAGVKLTVPEYDALVKAHGKSQTDDYLQRLSDYIASTGKRYKSHAATVRSWIRKDAEKQPAPIRKGVIN